MSILVPVMKFLKFLNVHVIEALEPNHVSKWRIRKEERILTLHKHGLGHDPLLLYCRYFSLISRPACPSYCGGQPAPSSFVSMISNQSKILEGLQERTKSFMTSESFSSFTSGGLANSSFVLTISASRLFIFFARSFSSFFRRSRRRLNSSASVSCNT